MRSDGNRYELDGYTGPILNHFRCELFHAKERNRHSLSHMFMFTQIVSQRDRERWKGIIISGIILWMLQPATTRSFNRIRAHIRCPLVWVLRNVHHNAWPCTECSILFLLSLYLPPLVLASPITCSAAAPASVCNFIASHLTHNARPDFHIHLFFYVGPAEIRRIDIYSKHVRVVFDTMEDEQEHERSEKKTGTKNPRLKRAQRTGIHFASQPASSQPDTSESVCVYVCVRFAFRMPAFIFPFFFVRRNLCSIFSLSLLASRTHSAQSSYFDRKQMFRKKSLHIYRAISCWLRWFLWHFFPLSPSPRPPPHFPSVLCTAQHPFLASSTGTYLRFLHMRAVIVLPWLFAVRFFLGLFSSRLIQFNSV